MQIFVRGASITDNEKITLEVEPSDLISDVKKKIEVKVKIPICQQKLFYQSKGLDDDKTLAFNNVHKDSTLKLELIGSSVQPKKDNIEKDEKDKKEKGTIEKGEKENDSIEKGEKEKGSKENGCSHGPTVQTEKEKIEKGEKEQGSQENDIDSPEVEDACKKFHDKLNESINDDVKTEVELRTQTFKKLEKQKIENKKEIVNLEMRHGNAAVRFEVRKNLFETEKKIKDKEVQKAKVNLRKWQNTLNEREQLRRNLDNEQQQDIDQTSNIKNERAQEIGSLKRKNGDIEKEQDDLVKKKYDGENYQDYLIKKKVNDGRLETISTTIEAKMKDLECPVCFLSAETPIFQCTSGHLICNECLPKLKICPECQTKYPDIRVHNRFAEKMDEEIKKLSTAKKSLLDGI